MQANVAQTDTRVDQALVTRLARFMKFLMHNTGRDFFRVIGELELSLSQIRILHVLVFEREDASMKQLSDQIGLSMPAISRSVESLVKRGLVSRAENAEDRRLKAVAATDAGRDLVDRLVDLRFAGLEEFAATLSPDESQALAAALEPIVARSDVPPLRPPRTSPAPVES